MFMFSFALICLWMSYSVDMLLRDDHVVDYTFFELFLVIVHSFIYPVAFVVYEAYYLLEYRPHELINMVRICYGYKESK